LNAVLEIVRMKKRLQDSVLNWMGRLKNTLAGMPGKPLTLVTAPPWGVHNPPVGLAYLSTYLRHHQIEVEVFDFNIALYRKIDPKWHKMWLPEYKNIWSHSERYSELSRIISEDIEWAVGQIVAFNTPIIGFSVVDPKERITIEMIRNIADKAPEKRFVLGGAAVSTPQQRKIFIDNLDGLIDYYVMGEGELQLLEIIHIYERNRYCLPVQLEKQKPLLVQKNIEDIDKIPHPTYQEFDFSQYDGGSLPVEWSRGCISTCAYCKGRSLLGKYRMKKAENIVREIEYHYNLYRTDYFVVCDNLLNGNVSELTRVCDLLINRDLPISWEGQGIPYRKMTYPLLQKIHAAGCRKLQWGLESGSDIVLKNIGKGSIFSVAEAEKVIQNSHRAGVLTEIFIMVGLPGENEAEFMKTLTFIENNHEYIDRIKSVNTVHLVHGTDLFEHASKFDLCLPEHSWYYLWYSRDGSNNYHIRYNRAQMILDLAEKLNIEIIEHNLHEGREENKSIS